jgi:hypothetical protein
MARGRTARAIVAGLALVTVCASGVGMLSTSALYTDSANSGEPITIVAASVALATGRSTDWVLATGATGLTPGDSAYGEITVRNDGAMALTYDITARTTAGSTLAAALAMQVRSGVTSCSAAGFAATGQAAGPVLAYGSASGLPVLTASRELPAGQNEKLCVKVTFPTQHGRAAQAAAPAAATFTFRATSA